MKKIIILFLVLSFGLSSMAFALTFDEDGPGSSITDGGVLNSFKTSKRVEIHALSSSTTYAARAAHLNGDREYGTVSNDPKIYYQSKDPGTAASNPSASDSSANLTGWDTI